MGFFVLTLFWVPLPQATEQVSHGLQASQVQSTEMKDMLLGLYFDEAQTGFPVWQSSNGIRIIAGASASTGTEAEAELFFTSAELFCTSDVAGAPGIAVASVDTGAPFNTGSPVVTYVF